MEIFLVRHGETDWNQQGLIQGISDIPLNKNGKEIATISAEGLRKRSIFFDAAYSSPLSRAMETARLLVGEQEIQSDDRLTELNFGDMEGVLCRDLADCPMPPPNGESLEALQARMMGFLYDLIQKRYPENSRILAVTSGTAIRSVVAAVKGIPATRLWETTAYSNLGTCVLHVKNSQLSVVAENVVYY